MGSSANAECHNCGYSAKGLTVGSGFRNYDTFAAWPVLCRSCQEVTTVNMQAAPPTCDECGKADFIPYGDKSVSRAYSPEKGAERGWPLGSHSIDCFQLSIPQGASLCPKCNKWGLVFSDGGVNWD